MRREYDIILPEGAIQSQSSCVTAYVNAGCTEFRQLALGPAHAACRPTLWSRATIGMLPFGVTGGD